VPHRGCKLRIEDILQAISAIDEFTRGMTFEEFSADRKTIDAVMHNIMVIGEAAKNVPEEITHRYDGIPWDKMRAIRNVVVHVYFGIRKEILWETIRHDLPPLVPMLQECLASAEPEDEV
jgi:uncharacterized protein with HEPN domain